MLSTYRYTYFHHTIILSIIIMYIKLLVPDRCLAESCRKPLSPGRRMRFRTFLFGRLRFRRLALHSHARRPNGVCVCAPVRNVCISIIYT